MEHKDVSARTVRESVRRDAGILERASKLKEEGRWFYRSEEEGGIIEDLETPQGPERTTKDVWDHCIEGIVALGQVEVKRPIGAQIASQIASKVQAYWEGQHAKQDKKRVQEERAIKSSGEADHQGGNIRVGKNRTGMYVRSSSYIYC